MKNTVRTLSIFLTLCLLTGMLFPGQVAAADTARVDVILVKAANGEGGVDGSLKAYAKTLERLFRFKSYSQVSRQTMSLELPGESSVGLAQGQRLSMQARAPSGQGIKADIDWSRGSKRLVHTRIQLRRGSPAVLGGPRSEDGTWLLILQLK